MPERDSITQWIDGLRAGDQEAARQLWERYFHRLVRLVRGRLPDHVRRAFDEEDIALSAFKSFCFGVAQDRFPELHDRDNLWAVLMAIGVNKALTYLERNNRLKRGGGKVRGESGVATPLSESGGVGLDALAGAEPTPAFAAQVAEECQRLLDTLADDALRAIAVLKMQGHTIDEIAARTGCTERAVQRKLGIIRRTWREAAAEAGSPT
ncbi:MAG: ECF-type sigma factor [Gemmataceae bacterium]|nr:ECF-type sigma factor [Gemmataceae bacterium]